MHQPLPVQGDEHGRQLLQQTGHRLQQLTRVRPLGEGDVPPFADHPVAHDGTLGGIAAAFTTVAALTADHGVKHPLVAALDGHSFVEREPER